MRRVARMAIVGIAPCCGVASGQVFTIWAEAPATVERGETYTVEFWASIVGEPWVEGTSAMAGFAVDAYATEGSNLVALNHGSVIADWAVGFGTNGMVVGADLIGTSGGQLAALFGCPDFFCPDLSNPMPLFSFDVTVADERGTITYTPGGMNWNGVLAFYPHFTDGFSIAAPNDAGTTLVFQSVTTRIVPSPGVCALLAASMGALARRRRRT